MKLCKTLIAAAAAFDIAYIGFLSLEDIADRIRRNRKKDPLEGKHEDHGFFLDEDGLELEDEEWDGEDFEDEDFGDGDFDDPVPGFNDPAAVLLTPDTIRLATVCPARMVVEDILFAQPEAAPVLAGLGREERAAAACLLRAYIGYIADNAPEDELSFITLMCFLDATEAGLEDGHVDAPAILFQEEAEKRYPDTPQYCRDYRKYKGMDIDRKRVAMACRLVTALAMFKLGIPYDGSDLEGTVK